jgi:hypothetical protein
MTPRENLDSRLKKCSSEELQRETLTRIVTLQVHQRAQGEILKCLDKKIRGGNGTPDLSMRVDRLEQSMRPARWLVGGILLALISVIVKYVLTT